ncbi:MAG: ABC transporter ATP-binding protein [Spirochaetales bacterium]|nr:ABC transporter ATP-binding protein [Spirochaetales bacterium]
MPRIVLEHVSKRFDKFVAVDDLNIVIEDRDFITLLGPSGCGKTTTLRMIAGLETPTEGRITIGDTVVFDAEKGINLSPAKRDIGFLFQNYALWPHMTVYQNIAFGLENLKWKREDIKSRVYEMLRLLKIEEFVHRYPAELSGGQQQRVAIARTLAPAPKVLFMDEPLSNLDAKLRSEMRTELKRLHSDSDSTFVYVTHDQLEAMTLATKICLMNKGVLQQYDPPLTVYSKPNNIFVADFVGNPTMNFINAKLSEVDGKHVLSLFGLYATFTANMNKPLNRENVIVGVRPEHIAITDSGKINATAYSALPAGMETTVKVKIKDALVSSVVFGAIDYKTDQAIKCDIISDQICIFDANTKELISQGSISINSL